MNVATRWNSDLVMIRSVLTLSNEQLLSVNCTTVLTPSERETLTMFCNVLKPFEDVTDLVQGELQVTSSVVIPCILALRTRMNAMQTDKKAHQLASTLHNSITKRLNKYETSEVFIAACMLDPRFRLSWCRTDADKHKDMLHDRLLAEHPVLPLDTSILQDSSEDIATTDLFADILVNDGTSVINEQQSIKTEIDSYLSGQIMPRQTDPLAYWKLHAMKYPVLSKVAPRYLSIPASSAPTERVFSVAGKIFRPERCRLSSEVFEKLMFIRGNA